MRYHLKLKNIYFVTRFYFIFSLCLFSAGCSFSYVDARGDKHVIGLVDIKIARHGDLNKNGAELNEVSSIGLTFYRNSENSGVALGYNREMVMSVRGDTCVAMELHPTRWIDVTKAHVAPVKQ